MNIKQLRPSIKSRYKQGYINPNSCKKLFPGLEHINIIYRSSYERKFVYWLENSKSVIHWGSECFYIPYYNIMDKKNHKYYPDYFVEMDNGDFLVIEIKPFNQTQKPINENCWAHHEYIRNMCKWKAAQEFCKNKGYKFRVFTERIINKL